MSGFISDHIHNKRGQDLETYYRLNGAIYICNTNVFLRENKLIIKEKIYAYIMSGKVSIDIDNETDLLMCECLTKK